MKTVSRSDRAFTRVDLLVLVAIFAVLGGVLLPALGQQTMEDMAAKAKRQTCVNNLKQIGLAFRTWEGDYSDRYPGSVPKSKGGVKEDAAQAFRHYQVMSNELNNPRILVCPADTDRTAAANFTQLSNTNVSYFVGADADETFPAMPLSGDRNLSIDGTPAATGLVSVKTGQTVMWAPGLHMGAGDVGLADGSVQQVSDETLQTLFRVSGKGTNRLAIP